MNCRQYPIHCIVLMAGLCAATPSAALDSTNLLPGSGTIEYAFTPGDDAAGLVVRTIDAARAEIRVQAFSFTHRAIAEALIRAKARGIQVQVIVDLQQVELIENNVIPLLVDHGVSVLADTQHGAAHNKVILIDPTARTPVVITGSFNFTHAAQYRNAENLLVFRGNPDLARAYLDNWTRHQEHALPIAHVRRK
jgi:phosphatidylserine/phosphatidylglycerophosphate/cardiolipin synthase-like enzyme